MNRLVLDTSILIEYIVLKAPYRDRVDKLFRRAFSGEIELYVNTLTLSETLYVASRIYNIAEVENPNKEALNYIEWIKSRTNIVEIDADLALRAGELKKLLNIALLDCYVIATAETLDATPVFRDIEKEIETILDALRKLNVIFLNELET